MADGVPFCVCKSVGWCIEMRVHQCLHMYLYSAYKMCCCCQGFAGLQCEHSRHDLAYAQHFGLGDCFLQGSDTPGGSAVVICSNETVVRGRCAAAKSLNVWALLALHVDHC